jgi:insertion element IS1 protein InsB
MTCKFCDHACQKAGRQKSGAQKLYCTLCRKYQQIAYRNRACCKDTKPMISKLVCESVSVRGIARILSISINTVQTGIKWRGKSIAKPPIRLHQANIEVDELRTFIGNKQNQYWIAYALNRSNGEVMDFIVGKRSRCTLKVLVNTLLLSGVRKIGRIGSISIGH